MRFFKDCSGEGITFDTIPIGFDTQKMLIFDFKKDICRVTCRDYLMCDGRNLRGGIT